MGTDLRDRAQLTDLYKSDFYAWAKNQAAALRDFQASRPNLPLDLEHLIDEVEDLAGNKLGAIKSQLSRILVHYLVLKFSPALPPRRKWEVSIIHAQNEIDNDITPSIRPEAAKAPTCLYKGVRRLAAAELRAHDGPEAAAVLPETCPYTLDQLLDETWRPTNRHCHVDERF